MAAYDILDISDTEIKKKKQKKPAAKVEHFIGVPFLVWPFVSCLSRARHPFWLPWHWLTSSCVGWISSHWPWQNASTCFVFPITLENKNRAHTGRPGAPNTSSKPRGKKPAHACLLVSWLAIIQPVERCKRKVWWERRECKRVVREVWREGRHLKLGQ